jgi:hypothetical protein
VAPPSLADRLTSVRAPLVIAWFCFVFASGWFALSVCSRPLGLAAVKREPSRSAPGITEVNSGTYRGLTLTLAPMYWSSTTTIPVYSKPAPQVIAPPSPGGSQSP